MPQSAGYGEAEILRVGIRPVEALPTERLPPAPELRSSLRPSLGPVWVILRLNRTVCRCASIGLVLLRELTFWRSASKDPPNKALHTKPFLPTTSLLGPGPCVSPIQKSGLDACGIGTLKPRKSWALFSAQANSTSGCCTRRQRCRPRQHTPPALQASPGHCKGPRIVDVDRDVDRVSVG